MKKLSLSIVIACLLTLSGCATKRYGRMQDVNYIEQEQFTCADIERELEKINSFKADIDNASVDMRSVAAFLGDFGVGNAIEKSDARRSAEKRRQGLMALSREKGC
jgi:hypothetical protein